MTKESIDRVMRDSKRVTDLAKVSQFTSTEFQFNKRGGEMPFYIKIDFRESGALGAWYGRDEPSDWWKSECKTIRTTTVNETRVRDVLLAIANQIDPVDELPETTPDS